MNRSRSSVVVTEITLADINPNADFFGVLGMPVRYAMDRETLEQAYLARAQAVHPDRFAAADSGQRRAAMECSSRVNEGYRVLRNPVQRAEYLVKLGGTDLDSSDPNTGAPAMGQGFLIEMIEQREAVEQAREAGPAAVDDFRDQVEAEMDSTLRAAITAIEADNISQAATCLVRRRYFQRLHDELDELDELDEQDA